MNKILCFLTVFLAACSTTPNNNPSLEDRLNVLEGRQQSFDAIITQNRKITVDTLNKLIERTDYLKQHQDKIKEQLRFNIAEITPEQQKVE